MRILHPPAVGYHLQAAPNNNNSNASLQATAAILSRERTAITTTTTNNNGSNLTSKSNYSSDYTNLNGNPEDAQEGIGDYDYIRTAAGDDNVNVTISTQNSVKFARNQEQNGGVFSTNQNFNLNLNQKNLNLNQNRRNINHNQNFCARNASSSLTTEQFECDGDLKIAPNSNENFCNNLNQLNSLKRKEATAATTGNINGNGNAGRQIFEGNLNVLEAEETNDNDDDDDVTFECDSNNLRTQPETRFSGSQLRRDVQGASGDNLICNGNHLNNSNIIDTTNPSSNRFEEIPLDHQRSRSGSEELRKNLAKLDLDTNLVSLNNQRQNCQQQQNSYITRHHDDDEEDEEEEEEEEEEEDDEDEEVEVLGLHSQHEDNSFGGKLQDDQLHSHHRVVVAEQEDLQTQNQNSNSKHIRIEDDTNQRTQILENHSQPDPRILSYSSAYSGDTSPDDSLMEEEADAFSPTPSSCASIGSPELGNFTRGIINPNYPGFQHLAHTLSEHFVDHQTDPDDSDLSEFEIELSVESLDENFARFHLNNNNNNESNNNNDGDEEDEEGPPTSAEMDVSSSKDSSLNDELNFNLASNGSTKENCKDKVISLPEIQVTTSAAGPVTLDTLNSAKGCNEIDISKKLISDKTFNVTLLTRDNRSQEIQENEENNGIELRKKGERGKASDKIRRIYESEFITCDLDTYLKKFETASDIKAPPPSKEALCFRYEKDVQFAEILRNCPTPDILIKNDKSHHYNQKSRENRPDLLRNVSPKPETRKFSEPKSPCEEVELKDNENLAKSHLTSPEEILIEPKKSIDEISFSITPVDIVGDFGREIEREFGLIVSGYNTSLMSSNTVMDFNKQEEEQTAEPEMEREVDLHFEKTTDAALSDGKDEITSSSSDFIAANNSQSSKQEQQQTDSTATTCDLLQTTSGASQNSHHVEEPTQLAIETQQQPQQNDHNDQKLETLNSESESRTQLTNEPTSTKLITKNSAIAASHTEACKDVQSAAAENKSIPTAIVKPKYQKPSYDERQLPPIGLGFFDRDRAWYDHHHSKNHNHYQQRQPHGLQHHHSHHPHQQPTQPLQPIATQTQSSTSSCTGSDHQRSRKVPQQFSVQLDRNTSSKIVKRSVNRGGFSTLSRDKVMTSRRYEKDPRDHNSSSSIAIVTPRKKDKNDANMCDKKFSNAIERNNNNNNNNTNSSFGGFGGKLKSSLNNNVDSNRYDLFDVKEKKETQSAASFDVYNIETALPVIDLEAIENHLKKAKEEERKRRNDREEIRRRLAMGAEDDYFSKIVSADRPGRKPSLQSRLQSGMNLQICFMNEASSDTESPSSDSETCPKLTKSTSNSSNMSRYSSSSSASAHPYYSRPLSVSVTNNNSKKSTSNHILNRPSTLSIGPPLPPPDDDAEEIDFFTKQARLQIEARMALAQAKDMAHMQMEIERQKQKQSPITEVIRNSLEKVGVDFPPEKRRVSRQMLTDMNIAQLQIIVNELHTQIERLNEHLVQYLMERDDLHMSQDSMLVDIEDLTRYLGAKEQSLANEKASGKKYNNSDTKNSNDLINQKSILMKNPKNSDNIQNAPVTGGTATTGATTGSTGTTTSSSKFMRIASLVKK